MQPAFLALAAGGTTLTLGLRTYADTKTPSDDNEPPVKETENKNGSISAGGTVSSSQLSDTLEMESTSAKLVVESVLAESGDEVTKGTQLYKLTSDSVSKAEKTLKSELQSAESELLQKKVSRITEKNEAYALYQSELLLGETAQSDYDKGISDLDKALKSAYENV